jgi:hypothetical protein
VVPGGNHIQSTDRARLGGRCELWWPRRPDRRCTEGNLAIPPRRFAAEYHHHDVASPLTDARAAYGPQARQTGSPNLAPPPPVYSPDPSLRGGASPAAVRSSVSNDNSRDNSIQSETHIQNVNVQTAATDANGIARGIGGALQKYSFIPQANLGLA